MLCQRKRVGCRIGKARRTPCAEVFHCHFDKTRAVRKGIRADACKAAVRCKADVGKARAAGECRRLNGGYACRNNHMLHIGGIPENICSDGCHTCRNLQGRHRLVVCVIQLAGKHHRVCVVVSKGGAAPCGNIAELHLFQCRTTIESICADGNRLAVFGKGNRRKAAAVVKRIMSNTRHAGGNCDACKTCTATEHTCTNISHALLDSHIFKVAVV